MQLELEEIGDLFLALGCLPDQPLIERSTARQLLCVQHLHSYGIIHCDFNLPDILYLPTSAGADVLGSVKMANFGLFIVIILVYKRLEAVVRSFTLLNIVIFLEIFANTVKNLLL